MTFAKASVLPLCRVAVSVILQPQPTGYNCNCINAWSWVKERFFFQKQSDPEVVL